jgi:PAS domain S-box-containing protein
VHDEEKTKEQLIDELAQARQLIRELEEASSRSRPMEGALEENEERYRRITSAITDYIFTVYVEDGVASRTLHTPVCEPVTGYTAEEFNQDPFLWFNMVVEEDQERVRAHIAGILRGEDRGAIEHRILRKDGSVRWVSNTPVLHHDPGGRLISYDGVIRDITERKQAEEELQKLASLVRYSSELVNLATLDGRMIFLNETGCRMLGICPDDVEQVSISQVIPDHLHEKLQGELLPALMSGGTWEGELQYRNLETGRLTDVHAITFTITDQGTGAPLFLANVSQDITERKRAEEEKRRLETQLIQSHKMEALGTLAGGIAHDFNNILSAIIAYAQRGMQNAPDTDKVRKSLDEILKVSGRARDLVKQILAFSRRTTHEYTQVKLDATIKESLKMLRAILPKTIEIRQSLPTNGWVMADATQMHQVVMNLCANAAQAMGEWGGVLEVGLNKVLVNEGVEVLDLGLPPGPYVRLTISDSGHGMPPEVLARIFDPYFTTKEKGRGTGLGLSVVHGIVKSHKGAITCRSVQGEGTTFEIFLPEVEFKREAAAPLAEGTRPKLNGTERILFIDDEQILVKAVKEGLRYLGYRVVTRTSSMAALELFRKHHDRFDLVISDVIMPAMTGDRLAQELLKIRRDIPIILCTGYSEHMTEAKARDLGVRDYFMKPLEIEDLAKTIRRVLDAK